MDKSHFKVATATDSTREFSVWLPAGFTYVAIWEAPAQGSSDTYFYYSRITYTVQPFTPLNTGEL